MRLLLPFAVLGALLACFGDTPAPEQGASSARAAKAKAKVKVRARARNRGRKTAPASLPEQGKPTEGPNVLVVIWDTVRADHLSPYGYGRDTTPRLSQVASEGLLFERAVSPGMWTLPSHASMFTGLAVSAHGANASHKWLDSGFLTFAEHFRIHGWDTYLFAANPYLQDDKNIGQGFAEREFPWDERWKDAARDNTVGKLYDDDASNALGPSWKETKYPTGRSMDKVKDAGPVAADALLTWVEGRDEPERPWLAVLNYMEAHVPRVPSKASREALFDKATIEEQLSLDQAFPFLLAYTVDLHEFSDDEIEVIESTYDATLRDLDAALADLLDRLEAAGELEDTILVLTADHGEHLGEHHRIGHKYSVYNPLVRVPLIVRYPEAVSPGRVEEVVSNLSIFPTLTELAGIPTPGGLHAESLMKPGGRPDVAYSELVHATPMALQRMSKVHKGFVWEPWLATYASVETSDRKCIERSDDHRELYAMPDDLLETTDLAPQDPKEAEAVCARIDAWRASFAAYDPSKGESAPKVTDPDILRRLEMLGYVDGEEE